VKLKKRGEISGSHGSEYEDDGATFQKTVMLRNVLSKKDDILQNYLVRGAIYYIHVSI
jgi:hypothetical protein